MAKIGFTTGYLYKMGIPFDDRIKIIHSLGVNAIELSFKTSEQLFGYQLSQEIIDILKDFEHISIHAPWTEGVVYDYGKITDKIIDKIRFLCNQLPITGVVFHPDTIADFEKLDKSGLPILIENMDGRKKYGTTPEQLGELAKKYKFKFVLDLQHAYEHDNSMEIMKEFLKVMGSRLSHLHVSGQTSADIHFPVYLANNKKAITKALKLVAGIPKILEGYADDDYIDIMKKEIKYIKSFE